MKMFTLWAALLATPLSGSDIQQLLQQLDSPKLVEREAAERTLQTAGPRILDMLPDDKAPLTAETKLRIARIKNILQQQMAVDWIKPTRIILKPIRIPLDQLLRSIEHQTGNRVTATPKSAQASIDCRKLNHHTFWETVLDAAEQSGLKIVIRPAHHDVELAPREKGKIPWKLEPIGPFLLVINKKKDLQQELEIAWEPRLEPIWIKLHLEGPNDTSIGTYELNPTIDTISAQLTIPTPDVPTTMGLSGKITALIPGPKRSFRFPLADPDDRRKQFAQVDLELLNVQREKNGLRLALRLRYTQTHDAWESYRGWFFNNTASLIPSKAAKENTPSKPLEPTGIQTDNRTVNSIDLIYHFPIDGPASDYTFIYRTPIALLRIDYDFPDK